MHFSFHSTVHHRLQTIHSHHSGTTHWSRSLSRKLPSTDSHSSHPIRKRHPRNASCSHQSWQWEGIGQNKLGCQTGGLGNNKPPTKSTASHESSNFISVTGEFQSTRKSSAIQKTTNNRRRSLELLRARFCIDILLWYTVPSSSS